MLPRSAIAALAVSTALFATPIWAQAMPATVDQPVEITYYNYNLASTGIGAQATSGMIEDFEAANPNITVNAVPVQSTEMVSRTQADLAAGIGPDVTQTVFDDLAYTIDNFGAVALEDIVPAEELAAHFEGMSENGLNLGRLNGKTYALAYTFSTPVLFYNADLFRAAGLDPDQPPSTWDALREAGLAIAEQTDASPFEAAIVGAGSGGDDWVLQSVILSNGGRTLSQDRTTLTFAEPEAVQAVQMMRDLHDAGVYGATDLGSSMESMAAGQLAMYLTSSVLQAYLIAGSDGKFELRSAAMPGFGDRPASPTNSGSGLVIHTADPLKQRAAWELMKFMTSREAYTTITSQIGYVPLRTDIVTDPAYLGDWVADHPLVQPNLDQLERLEPWVAYPGPNYRQINSLMMDAMEMAVFGGADVEATLAQAQANAQSLMP